VFHAVCRLHSNKLSNNLYHFHHCFIASFSVYTISSDSGTSSNVFFSFAVAFDLGHRTGVRTGSQHDLQERSNEAQRSATLQGATAGGGAMTP
jgi:hypothetical protein